jgi:hypothetical protein
LYAYAQATPRGLAIELAFYDGEPCALPERPGIVVRRRGQTVDVHPEPWQVRGSYASTRMLEPKRPVETFLRWTNWCGPSGGPVSVRLTLGGVSEVVELGEPATPACTAPGSTSTIAVSQFVRR